MKSKRFFDAIGEIDARLIHESASIQPEKPRSHRFGTICAIGVSMAACFAVVLLSTGIWTLPGGSRPGTEVVPGVSDESQASEMLIEEQEKMNKLRALLEKLQYEQATEAELAEIAELKILLEEMKQLPVMP